MKRALIVDDEPLACELIANLIAQYQLPIEVVGFAFAGDDALLRIQSERPDLLFLDIELPGMNGLELMQRLESGYSGPLRIIVITAYNYFEYAQQALRLGAKDLLLKPIDAKQFVETIGRVLGTEYTNNRMFNEILEYVGAHFDRSLTLSGCAKMFHTSPNYLARLFMRHTSMTFVSYVNELRIKKAVELLRESGMSIKEIAMTVGFNNLNYFYKKFGQITKTTPKTFRE